MGRKGDDVLRNPKYGETSDESSSDEYDEDEEAYILRVYGSANHQDKTASPTRRPRTSRKSVGSGNTLRRFSKRLSNEFERRRSSIEEIVEEVRPKTPTGWTIFLSAPALQNPNSKFNGSGKIWLSNQRTTQQKPCNKQNQIHPP